MIVTDGHPSGPTETGHSSPLDATRFLVRAIRLTQLAAVSVLGVIALLLNSVLGFYALRGVRENDQRVEKSHLVRRHINQLRIAMTDAETGQRGYILTGDEGYLQPYSEAIKRVQPLMDSLRADVNNQAEESGYLAELQPLVDAKLIELQKTVQLRRDQGADAAAKAVQTHLGKSYMDKIRSVLNAMDSRELQNATEAKATADSNFQRSLIAVGCANLLVLLLVAYSEVGNTRRKRLQQYLELSEERYRLAFDHHPQPMWVFDLKSLRFLSVNGATLRQYGYSREEFLQMTIHDIRPAEDIPKLKALMKTNEARRIAGVWRHRKKDGTVFFAEVASGDVMWNDHLAKLVIAPDVSDRIWAERHLVEWKQRHEAAINASGQILYDWNPVTNQVTYSNHLERLGYTTAEMEGGLANWRELIHEDDRHAFDREIERVLETRSNFSLHYRLRRKDGTFINVEDTGQFVIDDENKIVRMIGFVTDVTDRALLQAQLLQAQKMEAVGRLAGGVAHDFNNMLGVIMGSGEMLGQDRSLTDKAKQWLKSINDASQRAATLTRQLLAFSRQQVLSPRVISFNAVIQDMESILRRVIGEDVQLRTFLHPELDNVKVDPAQLEQVIMNLAVNARDAMPDGGKLSVETHNIYLDEEYCRQHSTVTPGNYVLLAVSDTGIGMDSQTMSRIFEPFFTTKPRDKGTGLGLATVYGIVKQSGGHIWLYSEPNQGATFKLYFPCTTESVTPTKKPGEVQEVPGGTETILLAEDEALYRDLICESLGNKGYKVLVASDGNLGLETANKYKGEIDMLLTDAVMPGMNGKKLAEAISKTRPGIKVLYMSGYTTNVVVHHGVLDPGTNFIAKPFAPSTLFRKVREVLDGVAKT